MSPCRPRPSSTSAPVLVALALGLAACGGGGGGKKDGGGGGGDETTWTVFVYGHGDHNLSTSLLRDMAEMNAATLDPRVTVVVAADWSAGRAMPDGTPFPSGTEFYRMTGGGAAPELVGTAPELNFDDPAVMQQVLDAVLEAYPADRYGVVLWDHGGAWAFGFGSDENDTPADRTDDGTGMSAADAAGAIRAALAARGVTGDPPLQFFSFDTCLMAGNEVVWEFRDLAAAYLADAEIDFGDGWDYDATFSWLSAHRGATPTELAKAEVSAWDAQHRAAGLDDAQIRSHVALDLSALDAYARAFAALASAMTSAPAFDWTALARAEVLAVPGYGTSFDGIGDQPFLRDAGQLLSGLGAGTPVASAADTARRALDTVVIAGSAGALRTANDQLGVHLEAPAPDVWARHRSAYRALAWDVETGWSGVLDALAAHADATAPVVVTEASGTSNPTPAQPVSITLGSDDADVVGAQVLAAEERGQDVYFYGVIGMGVVEPAKRYQFDWNGRLPALSDGGTLSPVTLFTFVAGAQPLFVAPGALTADGASYEAYAVADPGTGAVPTFLVAVDGRLAAFAARDLAGTSFTPLVYELTSESWYPAAELAVHEGGLALESPAAPPGSYLLVTAIDDVWGNTGMALDPVSVGTP